MAKKYEEVPKGVQIKWDEVPEGTDIKWDDEDQNPNIGGIAKEAFKAAIAPINPKLTSKEGIENPLTTKEAMGVGQGGIQGVTFGYGMPVLRKVIPGSEQVAEPTVKESVVGNLLGSVMPGGAGIQAAKALKLGKLGKVAIPAAMGYLYNPSETGIEPAISGKRATGAALGALGPIVGMGASKIRDVLKPSAVTALTKALRPGKHNTKFSEAVDPGLEAIKKTGLPVNSLEDFIEVSREAKKNIWNKIQGTINKAQGKIDIKGKPVSDAMLDSISSRALEITDDGVDEVIKRADRYSGKSLSVQKAEEWLKEINAELNQLFRGSERTGYIKGMETQMAGLLAERRELRKQLYNAIKSATGKDIAPLKKQYGQLMNLQDEALARVMVNSRMNPVSLQELLNIAFGIGQMGSGNLIGGAGQIAASTVMKRFNDPNKLISRAVKNVGKYKLPFDEMGGGAGTATAAVLSDAYRKFGKEKK